MSARRQQNMHKNGAPLLHAMQCNAMQSTTLLWQQLLAHFIEREEKPFLYKALEDWSCCST
jgi:hypothetical protein